MTATLNQLLILATEGAEGIPAEHIAAKLAVPIGIVIFCGSVYMLLWSNYGAKKGALIYGTAFFGFTTMLGVFWWFGAPGTPIATGLQNFPGQAPDEYQAKWFTFEPGSERADYFPATNNLGDFETVPQFIGMGGASEEELEASPRFRSLNGRINQAVALMQDLFLRAEDGQLRLGGERRAEYQEAGQQALVDDVGEQAAEDYSPADPFFTAEPGDILVTHDQGVMLVGTEMRAYVNYISEDGEAVSYPVDTRPVFAFEQPSLLWFPSAVWTLVSLVLFGLCLFGLDRLEQREKRALAEAEEPERLAVPIRQ